MQLTKKIISALALFVIISLFVSCQSQQHEEITFSVMGCGPYDAEREKAMLKHISLENKHKSSEFIVHLGDITHDKKLNESHFSSMKYLLTKHNNIPTYIVPGDNEWNDQINHEECWSYWSKHLLSLESEFKPSWTTSRQKIRPENFAFAHKGILFIGLNLPGGKVHDADEWSLRHKQNVIWIKESLDRHNSEIRGAVLFFQAALLKKHDSFTTPVISLLKAFQKPVLIVHADHHKWIYKEGYMAKNITRIQTDKIGPNAPPVEIKIAITTDQIFKYNRRLTPADGFITP